MTHVGASALRCSIFSFFDTLRSFVLVCMCREGKRLLSGGAVKVDQIKKGLSSLSSRFIQFSELSCGRARFS